jgi:hypothetical protein
MLRLRERAEKMHDMIVNKQVNEFTPIENDAINLYSQVTNVLYGVFSPLYTKHITTMHGDYESLLHTFKLLNLVVVNDDNQFPYLSHNVNLNGRYIHDIIHYTMGYDFSLEGEYKTCNKQMQVYCSIANTMASSDVVKKMIDFIVSEVKVQALYHEIYGDFPPYQVVAFS